jgi:Ni,Fe-hydrogenase III large subunit
MKHVSVTNQQVIPIASIPCIDYVDFREEVLYLHKKKDVHCVSYFGYPEDRQHYRFICCLADDQAGLINILSYRRRQDEAAPLLSLTSALPAYHLYERELSENFGLHFFDHPWAKPLRYAHNRYDRSADPAQYPFARIQGDETHEVGVGPIHAGVIEPGHFRFLCQGENVLHLEIQLGYQHRGVEALFLTKEKLIQRTILAESVAGDTVVGHTLSFVLAMEKLYGITPPDHLAVSRSLALELERIAIHTGDLSAYCHDLAYQLGSEVLGALRTPVINFFQQWCGNRFAKGLIRVGYTPYPLTADLKEKLLTLLNTFEQRFEEVTVQLFSMPSLLNRVEKTGVLTQHQAESIGAVGMCARSSGMKRDIRTSHPFAAYNVLPVVSEQLTSGDVYARGVVRRKEVLASVQYIRQLLALVASESEQMSAVYKNNDRQKLAADSFVVSLTEGWRGEIAHCAVTGEEGRLIHYKIKDPSFHNWMGLALAVRNNEISDFPICNKSFNLSYCGHDL